LASTINASLAVSVAPGRTLFTVIPKGATSPARVSAGKATAPRTMLETPSPGIGCLTEVETMGFAHTLWLAYSEASFTLSLCG
jgi:hypothetical protein